MKVYIHILFIIFSLNTKAQSVENIDFANDYWFVLNKEVDFIKTDTITLYRMINIKTEPKKDLFVSPEYYYKKKDGLTVLQFINDGKLYINPYRIGDRIILWKWKYSSSTQILNIDVPGKLKSKFKIFQLSKTSESWKYKMSDEIINLDAEIEKLVLYKL
ncbi:hypothetical protein FCR2A7T_06820 [Flavobacterium cauense R2A-7]|uniref:Uncharacterized protein n=1 Tax=Flavobacterium cauense R2A-7 TaxID=1341154 RepID=V6S4B5_9FLAO|nr:hypothetical protein [Flavobacterium cauense]ESU21254.1 hypothetical protein FCR2A7T_06820 [Flavobacterium cauense R2A-7]KGO79026.1 hypothetical protein Q762_14765 [Flavobacterium cauense R2A-7]TWI07383.1 hypothetical protein IP98_02958 [Flavobacterium cauense R2A-7]